MVKEIIFTDIKNEQWKIYLCQEDSEIVQIKSEHGFENENAVRFEYLSFGENSHLVVARVKTICVDVFEQVCNYARVVGMDIPYTSLFRIIKEFDK